MQFDVLERENINPYLAITFLKNEFLLYALRSGTDGLLVAITGAWLTIMSFCQLSPCIVAKCEDDTLFSAHHEARNKDGYFLWQ